MLADAHVVKNGFLETTSLRSGSGRLWTITPPTSPSSHFAKIAPMPPSDIDELFAQTLRGAYDDDAPWEAVHSLRQIGTRQVFEMAVRWVESPEPLVRARGLDVLAQLGKTAQHPSNSFPQECYAVGAGR